MVGECIRQAEVTPVKTNSEIIRDFMAEWTKGLDSTYQSIRDNFTPSTVYENVGYPATVGIEDAVAFSKNVFKVLGVAREEVDMDTLAITESGDKVFSERIDRLFLPDGSELMAVAIMAIFEMKEGKIAKWREYFDTKTFDKIARNRYRELKASSLV